MKTPEYLAELAYNSALIEGQKLDLERLTEEFRKLLAERR
jgi:hypothetical protein